MADNENRLVQEGDVYPSMLIEEMIRETEHCEEGAEYLEKYAIMTPFESTDIITTIVEYFKGILPFLVDRKKFLENPECSDFSQLSLKTGVPIELIQKMILILHGRFLKKQYAFYGYAQDRESFEVYDITENIKSIRKVTTKECGCCRKPESETQILEKCVLCGMATYCNKECQTKDWQKHHFYFCHSLASQQEKPRSPAMAYSLLKEKCGSCGKPQTESAVLFERCGECKAIVYCGKECQTADWKAQHKHYCKYMNPYFKPITENEKK